MQKFSMALKSFILMEILLNLFSNAVPAFPGQTKTLDVLYLPIQQLELAF